MSKTNKDWVQIWQENIEQMAPDTLVYLETLAPSDFYDSEQIRRLGITCGEGCLLHKQALIINPSGLILGNNVRIDAFTTISTGIGITMGNNVHLAGYVSLFGGAGIEIGDYASIASGAKVYSVSDDIMGRGLVGPCVPEDKRHLHKGKVILEDHTVLAVNSIVMPGTILSFGSVLLPFSLLKGTKDVRKMSIFAGSPAIYVKPRLPDFLTFIE